MRFFQNTRTARYRAYVVPADAREGDYSRKTLSYLEAADDWEAKPAPQCSVWQPVAAFERDIISTQNRF